MSKAPCHLEVEKAILSVPQWVIHHHRSQCRLGFPSKQYCNQRSTQTFGQHYEGPSHWCPWDLVVLAGCITPCECAHHVNAWWKLPSYGKKLQTRYFLNTSESRRCPTWRAWVAVELPAPTPKANLPITPVDATNQTCHIYIYLCIYLCAHF